MSRIANIRRAFAVAAIAAGAATASVSGASAFGHLGGFGGGGFGGARIVGAHFGGGRLAVGQVGGQRLGGGFHVNIRGSRPIPGGHVIGRHPFPRLPRVVVNGCRGDRCLPPPVRGPVCERHPGLAICHKLPPIAFCLRHPHFGYCHGRPPVIGLVPPAVTTVGVASGAAATGAVAAYSPAPTCLPGPTISIVFQPTATSADITAFLTSFNVTIADGPNVDGIYRIRLPATGGSTQQVLETMRAQSTIVSSISG